MCSFTHRKLRAKLPGMDELSRMTNAPSARPSRAFITTLLVVFSTYQSALHAFSSTAGFCAHGWVGGSVLI